MARKWNIWSWMRLTAYFNSTISKLLSSCWRSSCEYVSFRACGLILWGMCLFGNTFLSPWFVPGETFQDSGARRTHYPLSLLIKRSGEAQCLWNTLQSVVCSSALSRDHWLLARHTTPPAGCYGQEIYVPTSHCQLLRCPSDRFCLPKSADSA